MPDYVIGDVHANPKALQALCELINLQPTDHLYFIGDLVGKGPDSWGVLKMLTTSLQHQHTLLIGNHDLHLLAKACKAPNDYTQTQHQLLRVYQKGHLALWHTKSQSLLAHAGVWPSWTIAETLDIAKETLETIFQDIKAGTFHLHLYGADDFWDSTLRGWPRTRCAINILARMRTLSISSGRMDFDFTGPLKEMPKNRIPWFNTLPETQSHQVIFGHWAMLRGVTHHPKAIATDLGYTYGGALMALRLDDMHPFLLPAS